MTVLASDGTTSLSRGTRASGVLERLCFAAVVAYVTLFVTSAVTGYWLVDKQGRGVPTDFVNVWAAGRLVLDGQPATAYDWAAHERVEYAGVGYDFGGYYGWHYPPPFLFAAAALAVLPYVPAMLAWMALTLPLYVLAIRRIVGEPIGYLIACAFPAALWNTAVGQNGFLTASLFGGGLALLEKRPLLAGVCFGLLTYKPQFGVLIPVALVAGAHWRVIGAAVVTTLLLYATSWLAFGSETFAAFTQSVAMTNQAILTEGRAHLDKLQSVYGLFRALGLSIAAGWTAQGLSAAASAIAVALVWRSPVAVEIKSAVLVLGALLSTPYAYVYDYALLAVAVAFVLRHHLAEGLRLADWLVLAIAGLLILTFPVWDMPTALFALVMVAALVGRDVLAAWKPASS